MNQSATESDGQCFRNFHYREELKVFNRKTGKTFIALGIKTRMMDMSFLIPLLTALLNWNCNLLMEEFNRQYFLTSF